MMRVVGEISNCPRIRDVVDCTDLEPSKEMKTIGGIDDTDRFPGIFVPLQKQLGSLQTSG